MHARELYFKQIYISFTTLHMHVTSYCAGVRFPKNHKFHWSLWVMTELVTIVAFGKQPRIVQYLFWKQKNNCQTFDQ